MAIGLRREDILAFRENLPKVRVEVENFGSVFVRCMTGAEREQFEAEHLKAPSTNFRARLVVATVCNEHGVLLFLTGDVASVAELPTSFLDPVFVAASKLNGVLKDDVDELEKK